MSQDVPQDVPPDVVRWLTEIQSLQRQVAELTQERDLAYASSDNLRSLYDAEAQQRQRDSLAAAREIEQLQKALEAFQATPTESSEQFSAEVSSIQNIRSIEQLQSQLIAAKQQCEQLKVKLKEEQTEHAQTRESLTAALGDAVDLLAKERPKER